MLFSLDIDKTFLGKNIKNARAELGLTQSAVAQKTGINQTQLSDYENGNKLPGLISLAKIANALGKSIDELCYGDESISPITTAPDDGRLIANCIYQLWKHNVIRRHIPSEDEEQYSCYLRPMADLEKHSWASERLLAQLDDYANMQHTFTDPELYLEQIIDSAANEIDPNRKSS